MLTLQCTFSKLDKTVLNLDYCETDPCYDVILFYKRL